jgi:atypical dual specificity phosphatase
MEETMLLYEYKAGILWGSSLPYTRKDVEEIAAEGIKLVISLETDYPLPNFAEFGVEHYELPISDFEAPSKESVIKFITILRKALSEGKPVLIHCFAGCGRTGTMLALAEIYLFGERKGARAIRKVREVRPCAIETLPQEQAIRNHARNPLSELVVEDSLKTP